MFIFYAKKLKDRGDKPYFSEQIYERVFFSTLKIEYKKAYMLIGKFITVIIIFVLNIIWKRGVAIWKMKSRVMQKKSTI